MCLLDATGVLYTKYLKLAGMDSISSIGLSSCVVSIHSSLFFIRLKRNLKGIGCRTITG